VPRRTRPGGPRAERNGENPPIRSAIDRRAALGRYRADGPREAPALITAAPHALPGQRIGLFGGSFDPPHRGHVHVTAWALKVFGLDRVWWLVSPGNPLKPDAPADLARRLAAARRIMVHPRVEVLDIEARLGTRYTAATLAALKARAPAVRFVWLMGADNLVAFHRWERWPEIMASVPLGVLARPGQQLRAGLSPAARRFARWRIEPQAARLLPFLDPPAWCLVSGPMLPDSSSELRALGVWRR
jgi:nicotinate-nucleotide adenylyltransferase